MNEFTTTSFDPSLGATGLLEAFAAFFLVFAFFMLVGYVIGALIYMKIAQKAGQTNPWIAWLPFGYSVIGMKLRKHPWYFGLGILLLIPLSYMGYDLLYFVGLIAWFIYLDSGILASFGKDKNLAFLHLIPIFGSLIVTIIIAVIAFGQAEYKEAY